jgi:hypothetical protein
MGEFCKKYITSYIKYQKKDYRQFTEYTNTNYIFIFDSNKIKPYNNLDLYFTINNNKLILSKNNTNNFNIVNNNITENNNNYMLLYNKDIITFNYDNVIIKDNLDIRFDTFKNFIKIYDKIDPYKDPYYNFFDPFYNYILLFCYITK